MIVISTGEVNREGWRLLPEGGDATHYQNNPILLFQHARADRWDKPEAQRLPIGRIENLRLEGGLWVADDPIFDEDDEFALKLKKKYDKGMLNAFSPGVIPIEYSQDPSVLVQGQTRATVTKWSFYEISLVDVPKDGNATRLCLSADQSSTDVVPLIKSQVKMNQEKIALQLGLDAKATEEQILSAIQQLQNDNQETVLQLGRDRGVINEKNEGYYKTLAASNLEATKALILSVEEPGQKEEAKKEEGDAHQLTLAKVLKLSQQENKKAEDPNDRSAWGYDEWSKKDPEGLLSMKRKEPEKYEALALAYANE